MTVNILQPAPGHEPGAPWAIDEAARFLAVSGRHVRRLICEGKVRAIRLGSRVLIADAELRRLAAEGTE